MASGALSFETAQARLLSDEDYPSRRLKGRELINPKGQGPFALLRIPDLGLTSHEVRKVPILLQKSQKAPQLIFRQRTKQATISDQCSLRAVIGIAREFGARWRGSPTLLLDRRAYGSESLSPMPNTFATVSAKPGHANAGRPKKKPPEG